jgi:replication initiation and membrane attachment protein DnaB
MNRNTIMVYEAKQIAMPDPRQIPKSNVQRVELSMKAIMDEERTCDDEVLKQLRKELDEAVLACFGLEKRVDELQSAVSELVKLREMGSRSMRSSTIESEDKVDMAKLRGAVKLSVKHHRKMILKQQTRLEDFADS